VKNKVKERGLTLDPKGFYAASFLLAAFLILITVE
jgi:hypothetical protein